MAKDLWTHYAEAPLQEDVPIVDAHHHLWSEGEYSVRELRRDATAGHNVVGSVFIECVSNYSASLGVNASVGETNWVCGQRTDDGLPTGIIGFVDMYRGGDVLDALEMHQESAGKLFKGVRHAVAWDKHDDVQNARRNAPPGALLDRSFQSGVEQLAKKDLVFETWCYFHQLPEIGELADQFPDLRIVVDHLGGVAATGPYAGRRDAVVADWRREIALLARRPNIFMKLGGIGFRPFVEDVVLAGPRTSEVLAEYWRAEIEYCISMFGADHCMFESNFPVDGLLCDYVTLWNVFKRIAAGLSPGEREFVFRSTAREAYRL